MTRRVLTPDDLDRLIKVLAMMGARHDGECLTAARMANRMVGSLGLSWNDLLAPRLPLSWSEPTSLSAKIDLLQNNLDCLTYWERRFAIEVASFRSPSAKQIATVDRLVEKPRATWRESAA
jgi:hypothetical protein